MGREGGAPQSSPARGWGRAAAAGRAGEPDREEAQGAGQNQRGRVREVRRRDPSEEEADAQERQRAEDQQRQRGGERDGLAKEQIARPQEREPERLARALL